MKTTDFSYDLPQELIAQTPCETRDGSRMLHLPLDGSPVEHTMFARLADYLREGDCLVFNDSRVIPARLLGSRASGGSAELLLLKPLGGDDWEVLARPGRRLMPGATVSFGDGAMVATVLSVGENGLRTVRFSYRGDWMEQLEILGKTPLPPYIKEELADKERYQTVYSKHSGSAAAPTAGLHFTPEVLDKLRAKGVQTEFVTLHVGLGTFRPVQADTIEEHHMHSETFSISAETAVRINAAKAAGGRVIAVGTTSCRVLESVADENGLLREMHGETDIFIYPGYRFKILDGLFTNFHLPESTLLMLVSALAGRDRVLAAYNEAVAERYRFFSFGDCMLIL
ncbi:MAG: tRNA preQ1(34) S-adenosylmethionine ribosyltransferase-isomerase QueA [Ruminococcaceae bacterium]|nr:tRNA preQ1(34) S-adenosylmethionine ribosyltransferase-isomerase QueA [Oscillospiraceae bacterium]